MCSKWFTKNHRGSNKIVISSNSLGLIWSFRHKTLGHSEFRRVFHRASLSSDGGSDDFHRSSSPSKPFLAPMSLFSLLSCFEPFRICMSILRVEIRQIIWAQNYSVRHKICSVDSKGLTGTKRAQMKSVRILLPA